MDVIAEFGLAESPVRLLLTGDMASEGVNLHRECHHLIHFDLPWSLITIEQRNGRIDRFGQTHPPDVRALVLTPDHDQLRGDVRVLTRLLEREHAAHQAFGESASLLGLHHADLEEEAVMKALQQGQDPDTVIAAEPTKPFDLLALLAGATGEGPVPTYQVPSLFPDEVAFVREALATAYDDAVRSMDLRGDDADPLLLSLVPPRDLANRFRALPQTYLAEQKVTERLKVTGSAEVADGALVDARKSTSSQWPTIGHLSPLHPLVDWLVDKVLAGLGRNEAPVIVAGVDRPTVAVLGSYANGRGQPQLVEWMAVSLGPDGTIVSDLFEALGRAGVTAEIPNPGPLAADTIGALHAHLPIAVDAARVALAARRQEHDTGLDEILAEPTTRLGTWRQLSFESALLLEGRRRSDRERYTRSVIDDTTALIDSLRTAGQPLVRVVAMLVPPS